MKNLEYHIRGEYFFKGHLECIVDIGSIKIWLRLRASKELIRNFINLINEIIQYITQDNILSYLNASRFICFNYASQQHFIKTDSKKYSGNKVKSILATNKNIIQSFIVHHILHHDML